jgi:[acyl-carrier-protein] S-malonyltransferase
VTARVRWRETMLAAIRLGVEGMVEIGAGKVLAGLARRGLPGAVLRNVQGAADVPAFAAVLTSSAAA